MDRAGCSLLGPPRARRAADFRTDRTSTDAIVSPAGRAGGAGAAQRPESNSRTADETAGRSPRDLRPDGLKSTPKPLPPVANPRSHPAKQPPKNCQGKKITADLAGRQPQEWRERRRESDPPSRTRIARAAAARLRRSCYASSASLPVSVAGGEKGERKEGRKQAAPSPQRAGSGEENKKIIIIMGIKVACEFRGGGFY